MFVSSSTLLLAALSTLMTFKHFRDAITDLLRHCFNPGCVVLIIITEINETLNNLSNRPLPFYHLCCCFGLNTWLMLYFICSEPFLISFSSSRRSKVFRRANNYVGWLTTSSAGIKQTYPIQRLLLERSPSRPTSQMDSASVWESFSRYLVQIPSITLNISVAKRKSNQVAVLEEETRALIL